MQRIGIIAAVLLLGLAMGCGQTEAGELSADSTGAPAPDSLRQESQSLGGPIAGLPDPMAAWSFDDCSYESWTIRDEMNRAHGLWKGGIACSYRSPSGSAGRFPGSVYHVEAPDRPELRFTTALTLSALVKPISVDGDKPIVNKASSPGAALFSYSLGISYGTYKFSLNLADGQNHAISAPATAGEWAHVVGTYDGQTMTLYINGRSVAQAVVVSSLKVSTGEVSIGRHVWAGYFHGYIDDVRLYNVALAAPKVRRLASAVYGIPQAVGIWAMDDCIDSSSVLLDTSGGGTPANGEKIAPATCTAGLYDDAVNFTGGLVRVAHQPQLAVSQAFTITAMVKPVGVVAHQAIVNKKSDVGNVYSLSVANGLYRFSVNFAEGYGPVLSAPATPNVWAHLTGTYDGWTLRLYLNGLLQAQVPVGTQSVYPSTAYLRIGNSATGEALQGSIDDVRLFNVALSDQQARYLSYLTKNKEPACTTPVAGQRLAITQSTRLCAGTYDVPGQAGVPVVDIKANGVTLECEGTTFRNSSAWGTTQAPDIGIQVNGMSDVTVRSCGARGYRYGLVATSAARLLVEDGFFESNFSDGTAGWVHDSVQGGGIRFNGVTASTVNANRLSLNWNGIELRGNSRDNLVAGNAAVNNSNTGALVLDSHANSLVGNDFRWAVRGAGLSYPQQWYGVDTYDSAGILLDQGSSANRLMYNNASYGGDGIFLRGLLGLCATDNFVVGNNTSFSPHNGIESWCDRNQFISNTASDNHYGLWFGGSDGAVVRGNIAERNKVDGISIQDGEARHLVIEQNRLASNGKVGLLLSGRNVQASPAGVCQSGALANASHNLIQYNTFSGNGTNPSLCTANCDIYLETTRGVMLASNCGAGSQQPAMFLACQAEGVWQVGWCGAPQPSPALPVPISGMRTVTAGAPVTLNLDPVSVPPGARFHWLVQRAGARFAQDPPPAPLLMAESSASPSVTFPPGLFDVDVFMSDGRGASSGRQQVVAPPSGEFLGVSASEWSARCTGGCTTFRLDDTTNKLVGTGSVRISTSDPGSFAFYTPAHRFADIDASARTYLGVFLRARNANMNGWQGNAPVVVVGSLAQGPYPGGEFIYTPSAQLLPVSPDEWVYLEIPLAGGNGWARTQSGAPDLHQFDYVELRTDTWGGNAYDIWVDGLTLY